MIYVLLTGLIAFFLIRAFSSPRESRLGVIQLDRVIQRRL